MDAVAVISGDSVSTRFSLSMENEQDSAGRGGRSCLARPNSQARTDTGKYSLYNSRSLQLKIDHFIEDERGSQ